MKDFGNYSMEELEEMSKAAFSEYYRLATIPCAGQPEQSEQDLLQKAVDNYEEIREEMEKRLRLEIVTLCNAVKAGAQK